MKPSRYNQLVISNGTKFIYNSFSNSFLELKGERDEEWFDAFCKSDLPHDQKEALVKGNFIVEDDIDEIEMVEYLFNQERYKSNRLLIRTMPSMECNFGCPYCSQGGKYLGGDSTYFERLGKYISRVIVNYKSLHISLFGGEPLIKIKETLRFLNYVDDLCSLNGNTFSCSLTTNGSLLTSEILEVLLQHNLNSIQITLDGSIENHNKMRCYKNGDPSFSIIKDNVEMVSKRIKHIGNFTLILRVNLASINIGDTEHMLTAFDNDCRSNISLTFRSIYNTSQYHAINSNNNNDLERFMIMGKRLGFKILQNTTRLIQCEASGDMHSFYVAPDLSVWKCVTNLSFSKANMGYIDEKGDMQLDLENVLGWLNSSNPFKRDTCRKCNYLPRCLSGCILYTMMNGTPKCRYYDMGTTPIFYK